MNQRGSATVLGIGIMVILLIFIAGLMPMLANEVKLGTINRDAIEAQYAAEAGTKRAITEFDHSSPSWDWLNSDRPFVDDNTKKYNTIIYDKSDPTKKTITPNITSNGTYIIRSIGTVGKAKRTVYTEVGVTVSSNSPFQYVGYAGGAASFEQLPAVNDAAFGVVGAFSNAQGRNVINVAQGSIQIPSYSALTALRSPNRIVETINGDYEIPMNTTVQDKTLIINGNLTGTNVNFKNANIFVSGSTTLSNFNMNGTNFLVSQGSLSATDNSNFNNSVVVTYGALAAKNVNLKGSIIAAGSMSFSGGGNFNYDRTVVNQFISGTKTITISNWKSL